MWRVFWTGMSAVGVMIAVLVWASYNVTFLFTHPRTRGMRVVIDRATGAAVVADQSATQQATAPSGEQPRATALQMDHNFGIMNPLTDGVHHFVIRNDGTAPLKLRVGPTTCKCTISALDKVDIQPGESTSVSLQWNTGRHQHYAHSATIYTNDPQHEALEFRVQGDVRMLIGFDEDTVALGSLPRDRSTVVERVIYSQVWDAFTVQELQKQIPGLTWEVSPADSEQVGRLEARSAQRLRLTIPGDLPRGRISDTLKLSILPAGDNPEVQQLDLPISGSVPGRVAFYGQAIDEEGVIDLGDFPEGQGKRVHLMVKVRDAEPDLPAAKVEAFPAFVAAEFKSRAEGKGLYDLTVEVPSSAPAGQYHSTPIGRIKIDSGHPRVGVIELKVTFAVVPREGL